MRFLIDAMFSPAIAGNLKAAGHDAVSALDIAEGKASDDVLIARAAAERRVIVTENTNDFARVTACPVVLILKTWWPRGPAVLSISSALAKWAAANPEPGNYARWLDVEFR